MDLEYLESDRHEYLDSFGLPLEPFEYSRPRGRVTAHVVDLLEEDQERKPFQRSTPTDYVKGWVKKNSLWFMVGTSTTLATAAVASTSPELLIPIGLLLGSLFYLNERYQRLSLEKNS